MSRSLLARLAELERQRGAAVKADAVPLATAALRDAGFTVYPWGNGAGLAVDAAPGLDAALDLLSARGIHPGTVCILRDLGSESAHENGGGGPSTLAGGGDRAGAYLPPARSSRRENVSDSMAVAGLPGDRARGDEVRPLGSATSTRS